MRFSRWLDHLPPWLSFGALASTGVFDPLEVGGMAAPLAAAALVEALRLDFSRWRRAIELGTLGLIVLDGLRRPGLALLVIHTLFLLCAARLILPRDHPQRRQILLTAFLLFLMTAITTVDLAFMAWGLGWTLGAAALLLQLAWDQSAHHRRGPAPSPPFPQLLPWTLAALGLAAGFFLLLPRVALGLRPFGLGVSSLGPSQAGFSDRLDLSGRGALTPNADVVMRIVPQAGISPAQRRVLEAELALLRGLSLNQFDGRRWEGRPPQWPRTALTLDLGSPGVPQEGTLECFVAPTPLGVVPLPYGRLAVQPPPGLSLVGDSAHGALRWSILQGGRLLVRVRILDTRSPLQEPGPLERHRAILTFLGPQEDLARKWSVAFAPGNLRPLELASRLQAELKARFTYTLDNPSGRARNPLEDFLENSRSGHCEYFASSLALLLRARNVPARVVNGFRLGPWIAEGGYWLVTQNEAHSWVEFWDPERGWTVADPTPAAPPAGLLSPTFAAALGRWMDAARFRWDRHVVRYSGEDQQAGMAWLQEKTAGLRLPTLGELQRPLRAPRTLGSLGVAAALAWLAYRTRSRWWTHRFGLGAPSGLRPLRPLLRKAGKALPPAEGETARAWLTRLGSQRQDRRDQLQQLAALADQVAYGGAPDGELRRLAREAARAWDEVLP